VPRLLGGVFTCHLVLRKLRSEVPVIAKVLYQFVILCVEARARCIVNAGWSWGSVSAIDSQGRTIWIVDAHRDDGKRFVVRAHERLSAFLELEAEIRDCGELPRQAG
jgi:hypothetical protein